MGYISCFIISSPTTMWASDYYSGWKYPRLPLSLHLALESTEKIIAVGSLSLRKAYDSRITCSNFAGDRPSRRSCTHARYPVPSGTLHFHTLVCIAARGRHDLSRYAVTNPKHLHICRPKNDCNQSPIAEFSHLFPGLIFRCSSSIPYSLLIPRSPLPAIESFQLTLVCIPPALISRPLRFVSYGC